MPNRVMKLAFGISDGEHGRAVGTGGEVVNAQDRVTVVHGDLVNGPVIAAWPPVSGLLRHHVQGRRTGVG